MELHSIEMETVTLSADPNLLRYLRASRLGSSIEGAALIQYDRERMFA